MAGANMMTRPTEPIAAIKVPVIELTSEMMNNCLEVNHCSNNPVIGISMPSVRR